MSPKKKIFMYAAGNIVLISGIALVLLFWKDVVMFFRGIIGMVLALAGLIILYIMSKDGA